MSNFFFWHNVFKRCLQQRRQKASIWDKVLNMHKHIIIVIFFSSVFSELSTVTLPSYRSFLVHMQQETFENIVSNCSNCHKVFHFVLNWSFIIEIPFCVRCLKLVCYKFVIIWKMLMFSLHIFAYEVLNGCHLYNYGRPTLANAKY